MALVIEQALSDFDVCSTPTKGLHSDFNLGFERITVWLINRHNPSRDIFEWEVNSCCVQSCQIMSPSLLTWSGENRSLLNFEWFVHASNWSFGPKEAGTYIWKSCGVESKASKPCRETGRRQHSAYWLYVKVVVNTALHLVYVSLLDTMLLKDNKYTGVSQGGPLHIIVDLVKFSLQE